MEPLGIGVGVQHATNDVNDKPVAHDATEPRGCHARTDNSDAALNFAPITGAVTAKGNISDDIAVPATCIPRPRSALRTSTAGSTG